MGTQRHHDKDLPLVGSLRGLVALIFTIACLTVAFFWRAHKADSEADASQPADTPKRWNLKVKPLAEPPAAPAMPEAPPSANASKTPVGTSKNVVAPTPNFPALPESAPPLVPASQLQEDRPQHLFDSPGPQIVPSTWGIIGHIRLQGTPPPEKDLPMDPNCGRLHSVRPKTQFYVVGTNQGLADVFVEIKGLSANAPPPPTQPLVLDQAGCEYFPYVLAMQTGQTLLVKNSDPFLHNVHSTPMATGNKEENKAQMPNGAVISFTYPTAEKFLRFKCDVHPWMFAYVCVADHPYFGLSNKDGNYHLPKLPPGYYVIEITHRKAGMQTRTIRILPNKVATENFTMEVKP